MKHNSQLSCNYDSFEAETKFEWSSSSDFAQQIKINLFLMKDKT